MIFRGKKKKILESETRTPAPRKHRSHFTDGKTLPRFPGSVNIEKKWGDMVSLCQPCLSESSRKPRAKGGLSVPGGVSAMSPWRSQERRGGWTLSNKAPFTTAPSPVLQCLCTCDTILYFSPHQMQGCSNSP